MTAIIVGRMEKYWCEMWKKRLACMCILIAAAPRTFDSVSAVLAATEAIPGFSPRADGTFSESRQLRNESELLRRATVRRSFVYAAAICFTRFLWRAQSGPRFRLLATSKRSLQARLWTSCSPVFMPNPPAGENWCAASPARNMPSHLPSTLQ